MGPLYTLSEYLHPNSVNKNSQPSLEDQSSLPMAMTKEMTMDRQVREKLFAIEMSDITQK